MGTDLSSPVKPNTAISEALERGYLDNSRGVKQSNQFYWACQQRSMVMIRYSTSKQCPHVWVDFYPSRAMHPADAKVLTPDGVDAIKKLLHAVIERGHKRKAMASLPKAGVPDEVFGAHFIRPEDCQPLAHMLHVLIEQYSAAVNLRDYWSA